MHSKHVNELAKPSYTLDKTLAFQRAKQFRSSLWRVSETFPLPFDGSANCPWSLVKKANQKGVWMLCLDLKSGEFLCRKVGEIESHYEIGLCVYGSGQDVAVVRIGQRKGRNQAFVTGHEAVANSLVRQAAGSC